MIFSRSFGINSEWEQWSFLFFFSRSYFEERIVCKFMLWFLFDQRRRKASGALGKREEKKRNSSSIQSVESICFYLKYIADKRNWLPTISIHSSVTRLFVLLLLLFLFYSNECLLRARSLSDQIGTKRQKTCRFVGVESSVGNLPSEIVCRIKNEFRRKEIGHLHPPTDDEQMILDVWKFFIETLRSWNDTIAVRGTVSRPTRKRERKMSNGNCSNWLKKVST